MPLPAMIPLILPRELVERILLLLDTRSMLMCRLINKEFNGIIQTSTLLQYFLACKASGVIDNPRSPISYAERLEALKRREDAWRSLKPAFETTIKIIDQLGRPPAFYELTAGNYCLIDSDRKDLYYFDLPSSSQDNPNWMRISGNGPGQSWSGHIVDTCMAIYEHDLIVNVFSSEVVDQADTQRHSLDLILLKFSTGEYHPLARNPQIHVQRSSSSLRFVVPRIVGDNLALVVHSTNGVLPDKLFVFDWKNGNKRLEHEATEDAYSSLVFVSPEHLLVPNIIQSSLEVWYLPPSHADPPIQILSLKIPALSADYFKISWIYCHGELSPFLHSIPYIPPRPFFPSPEDSLVVVKLCLLSLQGPDITYTLVMRRHALLDTIHKWTSPSLLARQTKLLRNRIVVHKTNDPIDGSVKIAAQSWPNFVTLFPESPPSPSPALESSQNPLTFPTSHTSANSGSSSISSESSASASLYNILEVQWTDWGPPISRWLQENGSQPWRIHRSAGQRYVLTDSNPHDRKKIKISVVDFNPYNVRRNAEMGAQHGEGEGAGSGDEGKEEDLEVLDQDGVFSEEMYMGLKCVVYRAPDEYDFDIVLMDEERLLGLKLDRDGRDESIRVLYFS